MRNSKAYTHASIKPYVLIAGILCASNAPLSAQEAVKIEVTGTISPTCSMSGGSAFPGIDPSSAGHVTFGFDLHCNAPFQYAIISTNGGLQSGLTEHEQPHARLPYNIHIRIPLSNGAMIEDLCQSTQLKSESAGCALSHSGDEVAIARKAEARISWTKMERTMSAGYYTDQLSFNFTVKQ